MLKSIQLMYYYYKLYYSYRYIGITKLHLGYYTIKYC